MLLLVLSLFGFVCGTADFLANKSKALHQAAHDRLLNDPLLFAGHAWWLIILLAFFTEKGKENVKRTQGQKRGKENGRFLYSTKTGNSPMMDAFTAMLEARDPALGRFRAYRLEAGRDLLGDWLAEITYGRIGTPGRRIRYAAE